jgi:DNA-binding LytR/AlgR family response regulator
MIKILIIEDEIPARKKLSRFLNELNEEITIVNEIDTVKDALVFLNKTPLDLIFSDIELLDGNAFEIYQNITLNCPIIFTTAYNQFWMEAFETNGIDYLLKPFSKERFLKAWDKYLLLKNTPQHESALISKLQFLIDNSAKETVFQKRFTINTKQGFYFIETENIVYLEANEGVVFAFDVYGKKHILSETTLKDIEAKLNPIDYYRISRSELVNKIHIEKIIRFSKNILAIKLKGYENLLKTSQSNTASFREWIKN